MRSEQMIKIEPCCIDIHEYEINLRKIPENQHPALIAKNDTCFTGGNLRRTFVPESPIGQCKYEKVRT